MDQEQEMELRRLQEQSLYLCNRLINSLNENKDDADSFFGGEVYKAYVEATESAVNRAKKAKQKIRNL